MRLPLALRYSRFAAHCVPLPLDYSPVHAIEQSLLARLAPATLADETGAFGPELYLFHTRLHRARGLFLMLSSRAVYVYRLRPDENAAAGSGTLTPESDAQSSRSPTSTSTPSDADAESDARETDRLNRLLHLVQPDSGIFAVPYRNVESLEAHTGRSPVHTASESLSTFESASSVSSSISEFESTSAYLQFVFVDVDARTLLRQVTFSPSPADEARSSSADKLASSSSDYSSSGEHQLSSAPVATSHDYMSLSPPIGRSAVVVKRTEQLLHPSRSGRKWNAVCDSVRVAQRVAREFRRVRSILHAAAQTRFGADSGLAARIESRLAKSSAAIASSSRPSRSFPSTNCSFYEFDSLASCYAVCLRH